MIAPLQNNSSTISAAEMPAAGTDRAGWTVVLSRGQSRHPEKRGLETAVATLASKIDGVRVIDIPHLYDLPKDGPSLQQLRQIEGNILVASWIFGRAARWVLDRNGIGGRQFADPIDQDSSENESAGDEPPVGPEMGNEEAVGEEPVGEEPVDRVTDLFPRPDRQIRCVELGQISSADEVIELLRGLVDTAADDGGNSNDAANRDAANRDAAASGLPIVGGKLLQVEETTSRRWYPVIDFDRCTNCMECVDFCLFGVYGLDGAETILVEQPDNCRKGCPACSRVCPENAIIFPQHKAPAIAGAEVEGGEGFKIDLSQLFGAPATDDDPIATAARERDEQLLLTGRQAVGIDETLAKRQSQRKASPKDDLDDLIDQLDALDV